ncbi:ATP-dependent Lon protease pim1, partial [Globodera pallida]
ILFNIQLYLIAENALVHPFLYATGELCGQRFEKASGLKRHQIVKHSRAERRNDCEYGRGPARTSCLLGVYPNSVSRNGPSGGLSVVAALVSLGIGQPVPYGIAMSGAIDANGAISAIGGTFAKVSAAKEAGLTTVILPRDNENDIDMVLFGEHFEDIFHFTMSPILMRCIIVQGCLKNS